MGLFAWCDGCGSMLDRPASSSLSASYVNAARADSTSIASIGYQPVRRELDIEFRESGDVYRYFDVPGEEHAAFLDSESKGTYLNQVFKLRGYRYVVVSKGKRRRASENR
jgi:hypothetical protein